ncbi:hypothetical protein V1517DRAFT_339374 [Lipomyces orientalis]|uniref:Uncharacterized protein n=1 Tax=Lipomyces orientalis TaxID=1233043 RepID=A0ACC3TLL2_9ASCO
MSWKVFGNSASSSTKAAGIPSAYMTADEDTRLAVVAGLIDSDGSYVNAHSFVQMTDGHRYEREQRRQSRGGGVYQEMGKPGFCCSYLARR